MKLGIIGLGRRMADMLKAFRRMNPKCDELDFWIRNMKVIYEW